VIIVPIENKNGTGGRHHFRFTLFALKLALLWFFSPSFNFFPYLFSALLLFTQHPIAS